MYIYGVGTKKIRKKPPRKFSKIENFSHLMHDIIIIIIVLLVICIYIYACGYYKCGVSSSLVSLIVAVPLVSFVCDDCGWQWLATETTNIHLTFKFILHNFYISCYSPVMPDEFIHIYYEYICVRESVIDAIVNCWPPIASLFIHLIYDDDIYHYYYRIYISRIANSHIKYFRSFLNIYIQWD